MQRKSEQELTESSRRQYRIYAARRAIPGKCVTCPDGLALPEIREYRWPLCETCYLKRLVRTRLGSMKLWSAMKAKLEAQDYRCAWSGVPLVLGRNATLDHILPKSRYPDLARDPDNVEWVDAHINTMKWTMSPDEFLAYLRSILDYRGRLEGR